MAASLGGKKRGFSEINVTPMVDVMLVLLVIFMVTAPLVQAGIHVDLPNAQAPAMPTQADILRVTVAREVASNPNSPVRVWVGADMVGLGALADRLRGDTRVTRQHEAY